MKNKIKEFYKNLNIKTDIIDIIEGHQLTTLFLKIDGLTPSLLKKILNSKEALQLFLKTENITIKTDATTGAIILQIPQKERKILKYNELVKDYKKENDGVFVNLGVNFKNEIIKVNLCDLPHVLIAGTTGSGKSVLMNSIILQLLENYKPEQIELALIDIKKVEFSIFENVPHLNYNILQNIDDIKAALQNTTDYMMEKYKILQNAGYKNIQEYNKNGGNMKYTFLIIDELAELLQQEKAQKLYNSINKIETIEHSVCRIAQLGRAAGIHLIIATQRPSSDVVSGLIKSNIPSRICLSVANSTNSRVIIDQNGAENLTGKGDLLLKIVGDNEAKRLQTAYIDESELKERLQNIKNKYNYNNKIIIEEKRDVLKMLQNEFIKYFDYGKIKNVVLTTLQCKNIIDLIIEEIAQNDNEKELLQNNYFEVLKNTTKFYNGYIIQEKEQQRQNAKIQRQAAKQEKQDKIINMFLWNNIIKSLNKIIK